MSDLLSSHEEVTATKYNTGIKAGAIIGRGRRLSNSSTTTTEIGVLEVDDIPIKAGRIYKVETSSLLLTTSVANDIVVARLRMTTDGSTPSTSSTLLTQSAERVEVTANGGYTHVVGTYAPTVDETLSILLSVGRGAGTGNVGINFASAVPIEVWITDAGVDPGDTGVDL